MADLIDKEKCQLQSLQKVKNSGNCQWLTSNCEVL